MNGLRDQQLHFRVSKQELERIWSKMESSGILSIGSYLRKMALDGYCLRLDLPELRRMAYLLQMCSNNLNQYGERRPMNAICDTTAKSETLSVKGCKVKITYAPADTDCLDAIQKLLQTTILRTAGHTAA